MLIWKRWRLPKAAVRVVNPLSFCRILRKPWTWDVIYGAKPVCAPAGMAQRAIDWRLNIYCFSSSIPRSPCESGDVIRGTLFCCFTFGEGARVVSPSHLLCVKGRRKKSFSNSLSSSAGKNSSPPLLSLPCEDAIWLRALLVGVRDDEGGRRPEASFLYCFFFLLQFFSSLSRLGQYEGVIILTQSSYFFHGGLLFSCGVSLASLLVF